MSKQEIAKKYHLLSDNPTENELRNYGLNMSEAFRLMEEYSDKSEEKIEKLQSRIDELEKILHISEEMAKDLTEQSEFIDGSFESLAKYYNFKQNLNK